MSGNNQRERGSGATDFSWVSKINWPFTFTTVSVVGGLIWSLSTNQANTNNRLDEFQRTLTNLSQNIDRGLAANATNATAQVNGIAVDFTRRFAGIDTIVADLQKEVQSQWRRIDRQDERQSAQEQSRRDADQRIEQQIDRLVASINVLRDEAARNRRANGPVPRQPEPGEWLFLPPEPEIETRSAQLNSQPTFVEIEHGME